MSAVPTLDPTTYADRARALRADDKLSPRAEYLTDLAARFTARAETARRGADLSADLAAHADTDAMRARWEGIAARDAAEAAMYESAARGAAAKAAAL